jgi:hypothetical protein
VYVAEQNIRHIANRFFTHRIEQQRTRVGGVVDLRAQHQSITGAQLLNSLGCTVDIPHAVREEAARAHA